MNRLTSAGLAVRSQIRVKVLGLIRQGDRIFVSKCLDEIKGDCFYRALGGSIEFGETSEAGLRREFREEVDAELINVKYLSCLENLFTFNGEPGHEWVQLYQCDFADRRFYESDSFVGNENGTAFEAFWEKVDRFKSGELRLVPPACLEFL